MRFNRLAHGAAKLFCRPEHFRNWIGFGVVSVLLATSASGQSGKPAVSCDSLASLALPNATITMAQTVAAGEFQTPIQGGVATAQATQAQPVTAGAPAQAAASASTPPPGLTAAISPNQGPNPAFCRVAATLKPSSDSEIRIEVWLPLAGWNGKFLGVANTGWAGSIVYSGLLNGIQRGFAAGSTDSGHASVQGQPNGTFIPSHPEKFIDYGYRAIHEMTVASKVVVKAYYSVAPKYSLFTGCSLGGMQALQEAYRYPADYEGIVAGAPANPMTLFNAAQLWPFMRIIHDPAKAIPAQKFTLVHEAAIKACASAVGIKQGFIDDPERCHFDPGVLLCKGADAADCLTAPQVELMREIYAGPANPKTNASIFPGPAPGAELQLGTYTGAEPMQNALNLYRFAVYQDPNWDWKTMDYDNSVALAKKNADPVMRAGSDLSPFIHRGGKLMIYIGWTDYHNPNEVIQYYKAVLKNAGEEKDARSVRLFTIPGMDHCYGGAGCDTFEKLGTIDRWVETGKAPETIPPSKVKDGVTVRTSLLCAYPTLAKYKGAGNMDEAENFSCVQQ
jgi:feruloyl esterase